ncbi:MAG: hypothetical protein HZA49_09820 [Planctomycetes bacterium]|nr:hypothetical protein [Planctomycetota bacterium]
MGILSFLFGKSGSRNVSPENLPWYGATSIYKFIENHLDKEGAKLTKIGEKLPDDEKFNKGKRLKFIAGCKDNVFWEAPLKTRNKNIKQVFSLVRQIVRKKELSGKISLYNLLIKDELSLFVDQVLELIVKNKTFSDPYLHDYAVWLAKGSPDRGPVKFGIALLGASGGEADVEIIKLLGKHDEFTLYSVVAMINILENPLNELWDLAKCVDGWGKINAVERMPKSDNPEIKDWLLRHGYNNNIMNEYLAYQCATNGDLKTALSQDNLDDELLNSAGDIIKALINGGPTKNIMDYEDGIYVIERYLKLIESKANTIEHFITIAVIRDFLSSYKNKEEKTKKLILEDGLRDNLLQITQGIINRPKWSEIVKSKFKTDNYAEFFDVNRVAKWLGLDMWDVYWERLNKKPFEDGRWYDIMTAVNSERIKVIVDYALKVLPLDKVATGPADEAGGGEEYKIHRCLDFILQNLGKYPSVGIFLVKAGLRSPVVRNRNLALRVLSEWGKKNWDAEVEDILKELLSIEPLEDVKKRIKQVLQNKPLK